MNPRPEAPGHGRGGKRRRLRWRDWRIIVTETAAALISDRVSMAAAGSAFFATLALFPAITTLVSMYGLLFTRESVEPQLRYLQGILPAPAFSLIADRVHELVTQPPGQLGIGLAISSAVTFWSASSGTKSVLTALNAAFDVEEKRSFLVFQGVGLLMTLSAMISAVLAIALLVLLPAFIGFIGLQSEAAGLIHTAGLVVMVGFVIASILVLYRFGPSRAHKAGHRMAVGALVATVLWLVASGLLSFYVSHLSTFGATYGSIGAVVGVMLWFYVTVYAVLLGAELNSQIEFRIASFVLHGRAPDAPTLTRP